MSNRRVLTIYMEPAPYVVGLVHELRKAWPGEVTVRYLGIDRSQPWSRDNCANTGEAATPEQCLTVGSLWKTLRAMHPGDILHLCGWGHPMLLLAMLIAKVRRLRICVESDSILDRRISRLRTAVKRFTHPMLFRLPDYFLPGGINQKAYLCAYGVPEERMTAAQMTVDVSAMMRFAGERGTELRSCTRARLGYEGGALVLFFAGRLEPHKGISDLLSAFEIARRELPNLRLMIAGDGSLSAYVKQAASGNPAITATGRLPGEELWRHYLAADIFVLPSRFEPWGLVVNEAMAFGLPVVVSGVTGCRCDLLPAGEEGEVFAAGDIESLTAAILRLACDPVRRRSCADAARRRIAPWTLANEAKNVAHAWGRLT